MLKMAARQPAWNVRTILMISRRNTGQPEHLAHGKGKSRPGVTPDGFSCDCRLRPLGLGVEISVERAVASADNRAMSGGDLHIYGRPGHWLESESTRGLG